MSKDENIIECSPDSFKLEPTDSPYLSSVVSTLGVTISDDSKTQLQLSLIEESDLPADTTITLNCSSKYYPMDSILNASKSLDDDFSTLIDKNFWKLI